MKSISGITLHVKDLKITADFYETLGFEFRKKEAERITAYLNWFWIDFLLEKDEIPGATKGYGEYLYISVDNVDEYYAGLVERGLKPLFLPKSRPDGRLELMIADPDGYNLVFFGKTADA